MSVPSMAKILLIGSWTSWLYHSIAAFTLLPSCPTTSVRQKCYVERTSSSTTTGTTSLFNTPSSRSCRRRFYHWQLALYATSSETDVTQQNQQQQQDAIQTNDESQIKKMKNGATSLSFSHLQLYVDKLDSLSSYKELENRLNKFASILHNDDKGTMISNNNNYNKFNDHAQRDRQKDGKGLNILQCRRIWNSINQDNASTASADMFPFDLDEDTRKNTLDNDSLFVVGQNRDIVRQLIAGLGFRITGARMKLRSSSSDYKCIADHNKRDVEDDERINTRTLLVTSPDPNGVKFVVTALESKNNEQDETRDQYNHFDSTHVYRFYSEHGNRQGISVLAFNLSKEGETLQSIFNRYELSHPGLLLMNEKNVPLGVQCYGDVSVLEVFAYYKGDLDHNGERRADRGTVLRFLERNRGHGNTKTNGDLCLPGLSPVPATFGDKSAQAAYSDHWVSNVFSRTEFLSTLEDTLGFTPKVNFNAGVVAAGESQIESTVTGNSSPLTTSDREKALKDQSQVYLPINNAMSSVGHVHGFLEEIGQGVQHVASRVDDLVAFVQRANDFRRITGEGLAFLSIPRSYYGVLTIDFIREALSNFDTLNNYKGSVLQLYAQSVFDACERQRVVDSDGAVDLDLSSIDVEMQLEKELRNLDPTLHVRWTATKSLTVDAIMKSRYANMYKLVHDKLTEHDYLGIVRNRILVDVQGEDLLFQIFTCNILQRNVADEAPFLEFIQRVCGSRTNSKGVQKSEFTPGCGGFGIRNFLTLFLSIEASNADKALRRAKASGDVEKQLYYQRMVSIFSDQLKEANPILTEISDAMTAEGQLEHELVSAISLRDDLQVRDVRQRILDCSAAKEAGNVKLMICSSKYKTLMKELRESTILHPTLP